MAKLTKVTILTTNPAVNDNDYGQDAGSKKTITFNSNPDSIVITPEIIEKMEKVQNGYLKTFFDLGIVTINFAGKLALSYVDDNGEKNYAPENFNIRNTVQWQWFSNFEKFISNNSAYKFWIYLDEYISNVGTLKENPILEGTMSLPTYNRDVLNPQMLNYSFNFKGTPKQARTIEQLAATINPERNEGTKPQWKSYEEKLKDIYTSMTSF